MDITQPILPVSLEHSGFSRKKCFTRMVTSWLVHPVTTSLSAIITPVLRAGSSPPVTRPTILLTSSVRTHFGRGLKKRSELSLRTSSWRKEMSVASTVPIISKFMTDELPPTPLSVSTVIKAPILRSSPLARSCTLNLYPIPSNQDRASRPSFNSKMIIPQSRRKRFTTTT
uniref:Uncharacterized protein n=1 Tax=Cacopsylla melanoneura TaxID=428564 RepID=A0A8D9EVV1_9HEMI